MKARGVEGLDPAVPLAPNAARIVRTRLDELRSCAEPALAPGATKAQHDMRIAAKRLRYVLEIVGPCVGDAAGPARKAAKNLQSALGDLHDCDLMLPRVDHVPSLATLLSIRRERLFHEFVRLWQGDASQGVWAKLETSLQASH